MVLLGTRQHFQNKKQVKVVSTSGVLRLCSKASETVAPFNFPVAYPFGFVWAGACLAVSQCFEVSYFLVIFFGQVMS